MSVQELNAVPKCRSTTLLSARVEKALAAYAVAAAAAGLGFVTLTPRAAAKIIYTPANLDIPVNGSLALDLNDDGIAEFFLLE